MKSSRLPEFYIEKELTPFVTAWMELESIMLSEISQTHTHTHTTLHDSAFMRYLE